MSGKEELDKYHTRDKEYSESEETGKGVQARGLEAPRSSTIDSTVVRSTFQIDEARKNEQSGSTRCTCLKSPWLLTWIERVFVVCICCAIAATFTVPIIIYAVDTNRGADEGVDIITSIDLNDCPETNAEENNVNKSMLSLYNDQCSEYEGICADYLSQPNNGTLMLNKTTDDDAEIFINYIINFNLVSEHCRSAVLPFLCQYIYPPCNISSDNVNFISYMQCSNIRDTVCSVEWSLVKNTPSLGLTHMLPICEDFDDINNTSLTEPRARSLQCHYQFKEFCGLCLPLCGKFSQYRVETKFRERSLLIFAGVAAFIGGIAVFSVSIYRWKAIFDFPSVLVVYNTACAFVIACFVLITYIGGQERLYCTHEALNVAYDNPSAFCQVAGLVFHWGLVLLAAFWLLHLVHLFIKIAFPMWSRKLDRKKTKIVLHAVEAIGAFFICGLAPIVFVSVSEYSFGRFPPLLCVPSREVSFYTVCIPLCVMVATGIILAIIMFWMLHKRQQLFVKRKSKYLKYFISFSVPEVKILFISCFFIIFGITALVNLSIGIRDSDIVLDRLFAYFACQARGSNANNTCYEEYDELEVLLKPELNAATYFLMGLVPWSNLLFAIQVVYVKKGIQTVVRRFTVSTRRDSYTLSTSVGSK